MERSGKSVIDTRRRWAMLDANAMSAPTPIFSVIVVCKNPGERLRAALGSLWEQHGPPPQIVVIDGHSTDGTREWLEARRPRLGVFISEPDRGVYDAMNKGLVHAQGEWVLFLGADDRLASPAVLEEAQALLRGNPAEIAVGEICYDDGRIYRLDPRSNPTARNFVHHQGAFYRRTLFAQAGGFDASLAIMADYDFNLRLWKRNARFAPLSFRVALCGTRGLSDAGDWRGYAEEMRVRHRHFNGPQNLLWDALSVARYIRKKALRCF